MDPGSSGNPPESTMLASGQLSPYTIAVDSRSVYWANWGSTGPGDTSVAKVPLDGGAVSVLASGIFGASGIAVDGSRAYFVGRLSTLGLMSVPLDGGTPTFLGSGFTNDPIALGPNAVYGSGSLDLQNTTVLATPMTGGMTVQVVPPSELRQTFATYGIATDAHFVYWITFSDPALVMKAPLEGGAPTTLASVPGGGGGLAVDAAFVYFGAGNAVMKVTLSGGTPTRLASSPGVGLAIDDTYVYFTDFVANVKKVPKAGGPAITLASGRDKPWGIAVDATSVYWADSGSDSGATGAIMKLSPK